MTTLNLTARVLAKFPARVVAGVGMAINKANGIWTIAFSSASLANQPITDPANTDVIIELPNGSLAKASVSAVAGTSTYVEETGKKNGFINGGFSVWQRTTSDATVTTTRKYVADRWGVKTGAGTLTTVALTRTQDLFSNLVRCWGSLALTGNAGVTTVDVDQRIEARNVAPLFGPVTFSALIYNSTGSAFTPTLFVSTPTADDNWAASNVRNGGGAGDALQSCPNNNLTRVFWSADISGYTDLKRGLEFRLRFPSGTLDVNTKSIFLMEAQVERRPAVDNSFTLFEVETFGDELERCQRYYAKSFAYSTAPATNAGTANAEQKLQGVAASTTANSLFGVRFPVQMRGTPTVTLYNPGANNAQIRNLQAASDWTGSFSGDIGPSGMKIEGTSPGGSASNQGAAIHWSADAEL